MSDNIVVPKGTDDHIWDLAEMYGKQALEIPTLYLAGPISPPADAACRRAILERNVAAAVAAFFEVSRKGWAVYCPHVTALYGAELEWWADYDRVLPADIAWLYRSDAVLFLPGWGDSKGCRIEQVVAQARLKQIYYRVEEVPDAAEFQSHSHGEG